MTEHWGRGKFSKIPIGGLARIYSCYSSRDGIIQDFNRILDEIAESMTPAGNSLVLITGELNVASEMWSASTTGKKVVSW